MVATHGDVEGGPTGTLSPQQVAFFETFGFIRLPGVFRDGIGAIDAAFEEVMAEDDSVETFEPIHGLERRVIVPQIVDRHEVLQQLPRDPQIAGVVRSLMGDEVEYAGSDGNLYFCDTHWHADVFGSPREQLHVKFSMYLDPVDERSGAIRVIPGSHFLDESFGRSLRARFRDPDMVEERLGVAAVDVPAIAVATVPGDVVAWNYRIIHASFLGPARRRHLSFGYRQVLPASTSNSG